MNAVARMTPEPKYLAMKKAQDGTPTPGFLAAKTGNHVPRNDPTRMTKMAEMRMPMRPSKSLSVGQSDMIALFSVVLARGPGMPMTKHGKKPKVEVKLTAGQGRQRIFALARCLVLVTASQQYDECTKARFQGANSAWQLRWPLARL